MTNTTKLINKLTAAERATDAIGNALTAAFTGAIAVAILGGSASAQPVRTRSITKPHYELSCSMTQPGRSFIRVAGQTEQRRFAPQEVCSVFRSGTETITEEVR